MGHRPTDWHVLDLEGDPTPGDPERVRKLARELHDFAEDVGTALRQISNMASEDAVQKWSGRSAKKFKEEFDGVPGNLRKLRTSYDMAGDAIAAYWPKLEHAQSLADRALKKGREARADLTAAQGRLDSATDWVKTATAKTDAYDKAKGPEAPDESKVRAATRNAQQASSARSDAQGSVDSAQSALDAAKAMAAEAKELREDAARTCQDKLDEASDAGIQNRSWWEEIVKFVTDNWDAIVSVCKIIVAVVGIIAMIVGGPILAAIVVVAAVVVLADTLSKFAKGKASLFDVGMAALDCIPGMKGLTTVAGAVKGLKGAATGLKTAAKAIRSGGLRNAVRAGGTKLLAKAKPSKGRCLNGDPIDMVSGEMVMEETDVVLPGVLPLVLQRTHVSTYRWGRGFGESWTSTLDQRVELDAEGAVFATEDGMLLAYPAPEPGHPVMPAAGPRWPLEWDGSPTGAFTISDPDSGLTRRFAPPPAIPERGSHPDVPEQVTLLLQSITDRNGNEITFEYDDAGLPAAVRDTGGHHIAVDTADDRITGLRLLSPDAGPEGIRILRYAYDGDGHLREIHNSSGLPFQLTYDDDARITSWTDRNGSWYRFSYDNEDRCIRGQGINGILSCAVFYDTVNHVTRYTNSLGHTATYRYNERLQLVSSTNPLGESLTNEWDGNDRLLSQTDALGHTTGYAYDAADNMTRVTRTDGRTVEATYNELGLATESVDADGGIWRREFDSCGNLTALTDPAGAVTRYTYTPAGHLATVTDALGHTTSVTCDPGGLPLEIEDALGAVTRYERDAFGRPVSITDPAGATSRTEWTVEGRPARRIGPTGAEERWTYDGEGNCVSHTSSTGATSRFEYACFDLLTTRTDPDGARYAFAYDTELHLSRVTNPQGLTWDYTLDPAGRPVAESDFDDRCVSYEHDAAGRLTARTTPAGKTIRYERDVLGRAVRKDAAGAVTAYAYDPAGRLVSADGPETELRIERDPMGRVVTETLNGRTTRHIYDRLGRSVSRVTPSGAVSEFAYDAAGNRTSVTASGRTLESAFDAAGHEVRRSVGEVALDQVWDPAGRLASLSVAGIDRAYTYREDGPLVGIDDSLRGPRHFDVDPMGRVTAVHASGWTEQYAYDAAGNQTSADLPRPAEEAGTRSYAGTRLLSAGRNRYEHDDAGRPTARTRTTLSGKRETWHYRWDAENRLTSVTTPDGTRWRYRYDPLGRRVAKQRLDDAGEVAEQVDYAWDGGTLIEETTTVTGAPQEVTLTWDHDGLHPVAQTERITDAISQREIDARFFAIVTDLVGTPTELLDETGGIAWRSRSLLWGSTTWKRGATAYTPLRFPGQYADRETGLHYNVHRYYDPATGRYLTPDPLGLLPAPNPATYVDNPHTWSDPLGLAPKGCTDSGGWYGGMTPARDGNEINHMPAKSAYKHLAVPKLTPHMGPSIRMEKPDHRLVTSTGYGREAREWQQKQRDLINAGRFDKAMKMDIDDIRSRFGNKYDQHIADMVASLPHNAGLQEVLSSNGWTIDYNLLK
ncbi:RHS repeat-associated core domain-containing protein [Streptomyces sp. NPDC042319]|uniref:RHS repeat-associated core domain-containing protein n=1 Tax=Streptomyces sp. NPDC042319 TaxID=3154332 RepID=UPI0033E668F6